MKLRALLSILVLFFCFCAAHAQETENKLTTADQRRIIEILLTNKFDGGSETTIYISRSNLKKEIQQDFPFPENVKVQLVSPETAVDSELCAYEFGEFQVIDKFVSVSFGNCRDGLVYDFIKSGDGWKSVSSTVTRQILY
ncbi:MAG TPA: hypothetical protein VNB22_14915 [Pyrinomonadaceae bacterium]|jgi:hypothetical protein|nr:hypothetical protein [Pyrinomonadaceae bacterium]